jgi:hypothetical protein
MGKAPSKMLERIERYEQAFWNGALKLGMTPSANLRAICRRKALQACSRLASLDRTDEIELPKMCVGSRGEDHRSSRR